MADWSTRNSCISPPNRLANPQRIVSRLLSKSPDELVPSRFCVSELESNPVVMLGKSSANSNASAMPDLATKMTDVTLSVLQKCTHCPSGGIGRRSGFKILCPYGRAGSSPASGTSVFADSIALSMRLRRKLECDPQLVWRRKHTSEALEECRGGTTRSLNAAEA